MNQNLKRNLRSVLVENNRQILNNNNFLSLTSHSSCYVKKLHVLPSFTDIFKIRPGNITQNHEIKRNFPRRTSIYPATGGSQFTSDQYDDAFVALLFLLSFVFRRM